MKTIVITGSRNSGKSLILQEIVGFLELQNISYDGIISLPIIQNGEKIGFDSLRLANGNVNILCRKDLISSISTTYYSFVPNSFHESHSILKNICTNEIKALIIDEIGILEMRGEGWSDLLTSALKYFEGILIITLRKNLADKLTEKYIIPTDKKIDIDEIGFEDSKKTVLHILSKYLIDNVQI